MTQTQSLTDNIVKFVDCTVSQRDLEYSSSKNSSITLTPTALQLGILHDDGRWIPIPVKCNPTQKQTKFRFDYYLDTRKRSAECQNYIQKNNNNDQQS